MAPNNAVLILGNLTEPVVTLLAEHCRTAGLTVHHLSDNTTGPLTLTHRYRAIFNCYDESPGWYFEHLPPEILRLIEPKAFCFVSALCHIPSEAAATYPSPNRVIGFSGLPLVSGRPVMEVAPAVGVNAVTLGEASRFLDDLGITSIAVPEMPGLVLGRVLAMLVNEAASALMEGVASAEAIDEAMRLGTNYPQGPLAWGDQVGLDVIVNILDHLTTYAGAERYQPVPLLLNKLAAGELGVKTGQGFHTYGSKQSGRAVVRRHMRLVE